MLKNLLKKLMRGGAGDSPAADIETAVPIDPLRSWLIRASELAGAGEHAASVECYRECLELQSQDSRIWCNFGAELDAIGQAGEAEAAYLHALQLDPALAQAWYNLGRMQQESGREGESESSYRSALKLLDAERDYETWQLTYSNLGLLLQKQGRPRDALTLYREALARMPSDAGLRSNLLFALTTMPDIDADELLREHLAWGRLQACEHAPHANPPDPERRIRVGYVSADFHRHPLAFHFLPLLLNRDRARTEVICYYSGATQDEMTAQLQRCADHWRDIRYLNDADADALIRRDGIDILVDLSGHTAGNRLPLFARKPAPVQLTYLGYANTTGLHSMDYRISDAYADPPGTEVRYVEKLLRMPHSLWCYQPPQAAAPDNPAPVLANGHVTFGSFNAAYKLHPGLIKVWADILRAVPDSRLLLVNVPTEAARERISAWFNAEGIAEDRIELQARLPSAEYWAAHRRVDLALDPFPCNGGATTCETLWLGVPVITLAGDSFVGRAGLSLLSNCGLAHMIAASTQEYVALAAELAGDPARLVAMRKTLQESLPGSSLLDGQTFARAMEAQYRTIWRHWCEQEREHA
ncbi:MAG: tetratricopeptide repeat protein [Burkholderiales bacterium]|nr:tetratricopeptide repeat protein [Burkholderiales bacterium]